MRSKSASNEVLFSTETSKRGKNFSKVHFLGIFSDLGPSNDSFLPCLFEFLSLFVEKDFRKCLGLRKSFETADLLMNIRMSN